MLTVLARLRTVRLRVRAARTRYVSWRRVSRQHAVLGIRLGSPLCPVIVGPAVCCCHPDEPCGEGWERVCERGLSRLRWVLVGHCGQHGGRS